MQRNASTYGVSPAHAAAASSSEPIQYSTTADIRTHPYEGERTIAAALHMDEIVPHVLSYMTTVELLLVPAVCHAWSRHTSTARAALIHRLHFGQFWSRIGVIGQPERFARIASGFEALVELNLACCNFMPGSTFELILHAIPNFSRLTKINLFYSYQLTDDDVTRLITPEALPQLRELHLGRVRKLTDRSTRALAEMPNLTYLNMVHNRNITEETLMLFDDPTKFPALQIFNMTHCTGIKQEEVEELLRECAANGRNANLHRIGGSNLRIIGPQELFAIDKTGKKMMKDNDADT
jgi:hypothetical protein